MRRRVPIKTYNTILLQMQIPVPNRDMSNRHSFKNHNDAVDHNHHNHETQQQQQHHHPQRIIIVVVTACITYTLPIHYIQH